MLFTATREIQTEELEKLIGPALEGKSGIVVDSVSVEDCDTEPGDPADLL